MSINDINSSLELFVKSQNTTRIENHYLMMGLLLYEIGDFENALIQFKDSYEVKKDINENRKNLLKIYMIKIYYKLGLYNKALDALTKLSKNIETRKDPNSENNIEISYHIYLNLSKRALNQDCENDLIDGCLELTDIDVLDYEELFHLYELYNEKLYLEMAFNKLSNEKLKSIEEEFLYKFLIIQFQKLL